MSILIFFLEKNKTFKQKKVYQVNRHTMGYLWTKYLKLRFLGLVPLVTRSVEKVAHNTFNYVLLVDYRKIQRKTIFNFKFNFIKFGTPTVNSA